MLRLGSWFKLLDGRCLVWTHGADAEIPLRVERTIRQQAESEGIEVVRIKSPCLMQILPAQKVRSRWQQVPLFGRIKAIYHVIDRERAV